MNVDARQTTGAAVLVEALRAAANAPDLGELLARDIHPLRLKIEMPLIAELERELRPLTHNTAEPLGPACARLSTWIVERFERILELNRLNVDHTRQVARASDGAQRNLAILDYARALGADDQQIRGDRNAFRRWFGLDAISERHRRRVAFAERQATFALGRLGILVQARLAASASLEAAATWRATGAEAAAIRAVQHLGDARVRTAGFACLRVALAGADAESRAGLLGETMLRRTYHIARQRGPEIDSQAEALALLRELAPRRFRDVLADRLTAPGPDDDFWLRRRAVALLCAETTEAPQLAPLLEAVARDPSPAVRQALAMHLHRLPAPLVQAHIEPLATEDPAPEVRAATLVALPVLLRRLSSDALASIWCRVLAGETDAFVLRAALKTGADGLDLLRDHHRDHWAASLVPEIERLHEHASSLAVRRWAGQALECIWARTDPLASELLTYLTDHATLRPEGGAVRLAALRERVRDDPILVTRVLGVIAQRDFSYDMSLGPFGAPRVRRGDRFGFRLWRAWHELRHASPDKRQAFVHTVGRIFPGRWHAPSAIMAELAQTMVPGEPLFIAEEAGWRPYLPLPDHALSAIDTGAPVQIVTSEGVTEVRPPKGLLRRLRSRLALSFRFAEIAALRNWTASRSQPPSSYLRALEALGFEFAFRPHAGRSLDPSVTRFFSTLTPLVFVPDLWRRMETYFFSVFQNTLQHLVIFIAGALAWFLGRHLWVNMRIHRTRARLPLVLGGWGTRGKSGTERIKAALINALGYSLVSKTTGNEAMFLYGFPFGPVKEMFLFRPYDKATIWEQADVARLATRLHGDVFLWECMGLTPGYVKVLQRHWMRDDLSTITNTYPDHEDLQGPAGRNIPEVMTNFIPEDGRLLTTEEQMRPILADSARQLGTTMTSVGWLEAGLLPTDALQRFPYEEHSFNIALVLQMAEELGVERDFALKEMADRVVPDLGVLKAYPVATIRGRRLEFVMGMSANERFGAMGNWTRMGFDRQDPYSEPGVFVTAVVNNRADRVPRSRVFADLLVNDVSVDRIVLIGSNLQGMQGYIEEAWEDRAAGLTLWQSGESAGPGAALESAARRLRIAFRSEHVEASLRAMLEALPTPLDVDALVAQATEPAAIGTALEAAGVADPSNAVAHLEALCQTVAEYEELERMVASGGDQERLDKAFRTHLGTWFRRKIVVVEDLYASGDKVIDLICAATPPGYLNRVMGIQNIKGTGLDFVYRWQAWEVVHRACETAESADPLVSAEGLQTLISFQEFGVASEERVRATIERLRARDADRLEGQLDLLQSSLDRQMEEVRRGMAVARSAGPLSKILSGVEAILDAGDAVRRRRKAERVYRDMVNERISHERAARELKKVNSRQKGGWVADDLAEASAWFRTQNLR